MDDDRLKLLAAAKLRQRKLELQQCLDASNTASRPAPWQIEVLKDTLTPHIYVRTANQCLAEGTLVMTPAGPVPIESLRPGDLVYNEYGHPIKVLRTYSTGKKTVVGLYNRKTLLAEATLDHVWLGTTDRVGEDRAKWREIRTEDMVESSVSIRRQTIVAPLGDKDVPDAYALGALLSDGCSLERTQHLSLSSGVPEVPNNVAEICGGTAEFTVADNYSWRIRDAKAPEFYDDWCRLRYAHEKIIDLNEVKRWNRDSVLKLLAGITDADGSVYLDKWNTVNIAYSMQSKSIIDFVEWAYLALWQIKLSRSLDGRDKYVNGPCHMACIRNNAYSIYALKELDKYLVHPARRYLPEYSTLTSARTNPSKIGIQVRGERLANTYDIHVDSPTNLYVLANGLITHNCGKTALKVRDYSWKLEETHPYWKRRTSTECPYCSSTKTLVSNSSTKEVKCLDCSKDWISWEGDNLVFLLVMQTGKQISDMWENRMKPLLSAHWRPKIDGGIIQHIWSPESKNRCYIFSHDNATEVRKRVQYFTAHDAWIDEMPSDYKVYEELQRRVDAKRGQFCATLTPKVRNPRVKSYVDKASPSVSKTYRASKFDNPMFAGKEEIERAKVAHLPVEEQNAILFGDWMPDADLRLTLKDGKVQPLPSHYSRNWDHVEAVDPASAGKVGYVIFAKDPFDTETWWTIKAKYIAGDAPSTLVKEILPKECAGLNIVKRVADPHESWFIKEAAKEGLNYQSPFDKTHRRKELIGGGEEALSADNHFIVEEDCKDLVDEIESAEDNPANPGTIKNSTKYHCLDAWFYGLDCLPKYEMPPEPMTPQIELKRRWMEERDRPAKASGNGNKRVAWSQRSPRWRRR